jgi:hypothetical protein
MNYTLDELLKFAHLIEGASQEEINRLGANGFDLERELAKHIMPQLSIHATEEELIAWGTEFKIKATELIREAFARFESQK